MRITSFYVVAVFIALTLAGCASVPSEQPSRPRDNAANINLQLGIEYLKQGNLPVAKEKLERAEKQNPRDPHVHSALALLYERLNRPHDVDEHYRTAVRLAPENPEIINNYAVYLCKNGRTDEGVKRFSEAARNPLYATPAAAYTNAGVCLRNAKRLDDAETNFRLALKSRPNFAEASYQLGELNLERGRPADARAQIDAYLAAFRATPDLLLLGVRASQAQGDRVGAEGYARRLRAEFPGSQQTRSLPDVIRNPG
jgi:type IV pilus assembly protein PilF